MPSPQTPIPHAKGPYQQFELDDWNAQLGSVCGSFHTEAQAGRVIGSVSMCTLLGIDITNVNVSPSNIVRSHKDVRSDGCEYYFLIGQKSSLSHILHQQRSVQLRPGDLILVDSSQQSQFIYPDTPNNVISSQISVHIPRSLLEGKLSAQQMGERIDMGSDLAQCVWEQLTALQEVSNLLSDQRLHTTQFRELFLKAFTQIFHTDRHQKRFIQIMLLLLREAGDSSHDVDHFANLVASSRRTFTRIFEQRETSFGELLKYIRLLRFLKLCNDSKDADHRMSISSLIYQSGFSDVSNFNHLFKSSFGVTPGILMTKDKPL